MQPQPPVYTCESGHYKSYFVPNQLGSLIPILQINFNYQQNESNTNPEIKSLVEENLKYIKEIYESSSEMIRKSEHINKLIEDRPCQDANQGIRLSLCLNFKNIICLTILDLKKLKLKLLPPQLQILSCLKELDVSDNQLMHLLPELQLLPLELLNISGNVELQPKLPEWLAKKEQLRLVAKGLNVAFLKEINPHFLCKAEDLSDKIEHLQISDQKKK